jgi:hypothetical protein
MPFPPNVKEDVLVACKRCCSLCHRFCGIKIEVHHIKQEADGGTNTFDNAIALCFDCHADMKSYDFKHPKGNKYTEQELRRHRDEWYEIAKTMQEPRIPSPNDIAVYNKLLELLPVNGGVDFVAHNNFAGFSFSNEPIDELFNFDYYCRHNPAFEFLDTELEEKRKLLVQKIDVLTSIISTETFPTQSSNRNTVPPEWEDTQPERFWKVVNAIHEIGREVFETYSQLIRLAVRKLNIPPPL